MAGGTVSSAGTDAIVNNRERCGNIFIYSPRCVGRRLLYPIQTARQPDVPFDISVFISRIPSPTPYPLASPFLYPHFVDLLKP